MNNCLFCDGNHATSACEWIHDGGVWEEERPPAPAFMADNDEQALRRWIAAGVLRPLADALRDSEEEVSVLETVHTDEDQRRRLARARRLVKAVRYMRLDRRDELDGELEAAEIALPGDARTRLVDGYAELLRDRVDGATQRFEEAEKRADGRERLDARLMFGRCLLAQGHAQRAQGALEALIEETSGERVAEVWYQLALCRVVEMRDGSVC